jgi:TonB family protein
VRKKRVLEACLLAAAIAAHAAVAAALPGLAVQPAPAILMLHLQRGEPATLATSQQQDKMPVAPAASHAMPARSPRIVQDLLRQHRQPAPKNVPWEAKPLAPAASQVQGEIAQHPSESRTVAVAPDLDGSTTAKASGTAETWRVPLTSATAGNPVTGTPEGEETGSELDSGTAAVDAASLLSADALLRSYGAAVTARIREHQGYPPQARADGVEGAVKVSFSVGPSGDLQAASVAGSSGNADLDSAALSAVRSAAPFAALPAGLNRNSVRLSVTLRFRLK